MKNLKLTLLLLITAILLSACQDKEAGKLDNRVNAYWAAKINKEYDKAYQFTTPGYKKTTSKDVYSMVMQSKPLIWTGAKLQKKSCSKPDFCVVELLVKYKYGMPTGRMGTQKMEIETLKKEKWLLKNNIWHVVTK